MTNWSVDHCNEHTKSIRIVLITGRTIAQGSFAGHGKGWFDYTREVSTIVLSEEDMQSLKVSPGQAVRVKGQRGEAICICKKGDLPQGVGFLPYGRTANILAGSDTAATGMPIYKGLVVAVEA
ncbi:MAG TPA: formylmethanofuran dehydrogenase [Clostridia bacterium]|nr:formylmethanofuran dehydrogenase [Clostridia bacterium]